MNVLDKFILNCTMYNNSDRTKKMEWKYALEYPNPFRVHANAPSYKPIEICGILQDNYSKLFADKEYTTLRETIYEGNMGRLFKENNRKKCLESDNSSHLRDKFSIL